MLMAAFCVVYLLGVGQQQSSAFVPPALAAESAAPTAGDLVKKSQMAAVAALLSSAAAPVPAFAADDDEEEGFDFRIIAVLGLPLIAVSWALFNVWRVAFRQTLRLGESVSGSSKSGL